MKILHLFFGNINSLAGDWEIDFEDPVFGEGLFALTGPTGAGKTSVLDAICLALYGKTARQEISKEHNEVMTRGTFRCHAEVVFEVQGRRYTCKWSQHRASKKPDGQLQVPQRELADASGTPIETQIRAVEAKVADLTGMSFDQFTRAVLLAQGQFDTFLKAKEADRADILEKITRTDIYSRLGDAVFKRFQEEKRKKEDLELAQSTIVVMPAEERATLDEQYAADLKRQAEEQSALETIGRQLLWLETLAKLDADQARIARQRDDVSARRTAAGPDLAKLVSAESARKCDPDWQALDTARRRHTEADGNLKTRMEQSENAGKAASEMVPRLEAAHKAAATAKQALEAALPMLKQVRQLDEGIALAAKEYEGTAKALGNAQRVLAEASASLDQATKNQAEAQTELKGAQDYQTAHAVDGTIAIQLPQIANLQAEWRVLNQNADRAKSEAVSKAKDVEVAEKALAKIVAKRQTEEELVRTAQAALEAHKPELDKASAAKQSAETAFRQAESEFEQKEPQLEQQAIGVEKALHEANLVASYEEKRKQLADGHPCPLCGAKEHPYAHGQRPEPSGAEKALKAIRDDIAKLQNAVKSARKQYDAASKVYEQVQAAAAQKEKAVADAHSRQKLAAQEATAAAENRTKAKAAAETAQKAAAEALDRAQTGWTAIAGQLDGLGVAGATPAAWESAVAQLKDRQSNYESQTRLAQTAEVRSAEALKAIADARKRVEAAKADLAAKQTEQTAKEQALEALRKSRREQHGDLDPEAEEKRLRQARQDADGGHGLLDKEHAALKQAAENAAKEAVAAKAQLEQATAALQKAETAAIAKWRGAGFDSEALYRDARWTDTEMDRAVQLRTELDQAEIQLAALAAANAEQQKAEREKALTDRPADELKTEQEAKAAAKKTEDEKLKDLEFRLRTDHDNRSRLAAQGAELERQRAVFDRWNRLNDMIGTQNGVRFKKFAQGITLSRLLLVANPYLAGMTRNRYALLWDQESDDALLPCVVDAHQADALRPISNLSGGETFMVSLALALGLAGMASGRLRVDSLFLDEGFGTLDNEALDLAIGTLGQLHQAQGKLIGVISHLDALKTQIPTKIEVKKVGNGRSELSGPGVKRHTSAGVETAKNEPAADPDAQPKRRGRPRKPKTIEPEAPPGEN